MFFLNNQRCALIFNKWLDLWLSSTDLIEEEALTKSREFATIKFSMEQKFRVRKIII